MSWWGIALIAVGAGAVGLLSVLSVTLGDYSDDKEKWYKDMKKKEKSNVDKNSNNTK